MPLKYTVLDDYDIVEANLILLQFLTDPRISSSQTASIETHRSLCNSLKPPSQSMLSIKKGCNLQFESKTFLHCLGKGLAEQLFCLVNSYVS